MSSPSPIFVAGTSRSGTSQIADALTERLWGLIPEATIVHIKRHPVAMLASHLHQPWAPPTVDGALAYVLPLYHRWLTSKSRTDLTARRHVEAKAEDLAADWPGRRRVLFEQLGEGQ